MCLTLNSKMSIKLNLLMNKPLSLERGYVNLVQVSVHGNIEQALRALKKKMQREGIFREMKLRRHYEKNSEKNKRRSAESDRRRRKLERKRSD